MELCKLASGAFLVLLITVTAIVLMVEMKKSSEDEDQIDSKEEENVDNNGAKCLFCINSATPISYTHSAWD